MINSCRDFSVENVCGFLDWDFSFYMLSAVCDYSTANGKHCSQQVPVNNV